MKLSTCVICGREFSPTKKELRCHRPAICGIDCLLQFSPEIRPKIEETIKSRVSISTTSGCWVWQRARTKVRGGRLGYPLISIAGRVYKGNRVAYQVFNGKVSADLAVLHQCDNPGCLNPSHLFLGTQQDNVADMVAKGRARSRSKLSAEKVVEIRRLLAGRVPKRAIARQFDIDPSSIRMIASGKAYRHVTGGAL